MSSELVNAVAQRNFRKVEDLLLDMKTGRRPDIDINRCNTFTKLNALHYAVMHEEYQLIDTLVHFGADVNKIGGHECHTPLAMALFKNNSKLINFLTDHGAGVNVVDENGVSSLHLAVSGNLCYETKILLSIPTTDINIRGKNGRTPLHYAVRIRSSYNMIQLLLQHGADPNIPDFDGFTPLHLAVKSVKMDIFRTVELLLQHGANSLYMTDEGKTPADTLRHYRDIYYRVLLHEDVEISIKLLETHLPSFQALIVSSIYRNKIDVSKLPPLFLLQDSLLPC